MDKIIMGIVEGKVIRENQVPMSYVLGSCVGICLYDRRERTTGMAYIILPGRKYSIHWDNAYKLADEGVHELINQMREQGARPTGLIVRIAGSAGMFSTPPGMLSIGQQNVVAVRKRPAQEGIRLVAQHAGQNYSKTILFYVENGGLGVNTARHSVVVL